jgi:hypothetical protein
MVSSLALLSCSSAEVEAFHYSTTKSGFSQRQNVVGTTAAASTKLGAATLAVSFEEDLALTRQIILDHQARSETVSQEQFIQQMEELVKSDDAMTVVPTKVELVADSVDISVPYDAAARLAYESLEDKSATSFDAFQTQYLADAVALVKSKQPKQQREGDVVSSSIAAEIIISETQTTTATNDTTSEESLLKTVGSWFGGLFSKN